MREKKIGAPILGVYPIFPTYSSIPGNRNWQIETADWNLEVRLDILGFSKETLCTPKNIA